MAFLKRARQLRALASELQYVRPDITLTREEIGVLIESLRGEIRGLEAKLGELDAKLDSTADSQAERDRRLLDAVQFVADDEIENRRRVRALRESPDYERPYTEKNPLVSVTIPTYQNVEALIDRSVPSVLNQTYENLEVVIVGDCAPDETGEALEKLGDPRIRYTNLPYRGPYPTDPFSFWMVAGTHPTNLARRLARGTWIAPLNDDDAFRPDHIEVLLEAARETRAEVTYGYYLQHLKDGSEERLGKFPPELAQFVWQAALVHPGLYFMEYELAAEIFGWPGDWSLCRRMLRAGVSFRMVDQIVTDYYPSRSWNEERELLNNLPDRVRSNDR